ncbi:MAG: PhnD/SsuA/transferrin family substrate-binding protein [bacterium]|jgi:phosphonate transport system substrate-binding protein|nr:PhnD/SsuA/transferrin family substrate-binding protein [candidate division KSB1 bacterium]MDH7560632.1 PhnD/SsuA/transferrin family substrate-binding protein [bacterium]
MKRKFAYLAVSICLFVAISLGLYAVVMDIGTRTAPRHAGAPRQSITKRDTIRVGVVSRFAPNLIYQGYQPIVDYLNEVTPYHFVLKLGGSYEETIQQLARGEVHLAFVGTFVYLKARHKYPIRCLLSPLNSRYEPYFRSVLVTLADSPIRRVADLAGKSLALPSPMSFSANWLLRVELPKHGLHPTDLAAVRHFDFHHTVIYEILSGRVDAGVVKDRVAEEFFGKGIRVVASSPPIPGSPLIVRNDLDSTLVLAIQEALLRVDTRKTEYRQLMRDWDPEFTHGFTRAQEAAYDGAEHALPSGEDEP